MDTNTTGRSNPLIDALKQLSEMMTEIKAAEPIKSAQEALDAIDRHYMDLRKSPQEAFREVGKVLANYHLNKAKDANAEKAEATTKPAMPNIFADLLNG